MSGEETVRVTIEVPKRYIDKKIETGAIDKEEGDLEVRIREHVQNFFNHSLESSELGFILFQFEHRAGKALRDELGVEYLDEFAEELLVDYAAGSLKSADDFRDEVKEVVGTLKDAVKMFETSPPVRDICESD